MTKLYRDYFWKGGIPYGKEPTNASGLTYKIVMDPYRKRISIEKYADNIFSAIIYDSALLDFRHLKSVDQASWQKTTTVDSAEKTICFIRNQDDRLMFIETHLFEGQYARDCLVHSPHGVLLSRHRTFYVALKDPFNGVILYDQNEHPVLMKRYAVDEASGDFTELIEEQWDMLTFDDIHAMRFSLQR